MTPRERKYHKKRKLYKKGILLYVDKGLFGLFEHVKQLLGGDIKVVSAKLEK